MVLIQESLVIKLRVGNNEVQQGLIDLVSLIDLF